MADMETIVSLAKRRGFIFQSSEIYGGLASTWDYGPLGVELKRNVKEAWWRTFVHQRDDMVGLDASILMARQVWAASGHEASFSDPMVECKSCHHRFREDQISHQTTIPEFGIVDVSDARLGLRTFDGRSFLILQDLRVTATEGSFAAASIWLRTGDPNKPSVDAQSVGDVLLLVQSPGWRPLSSGSFLPNESGAYVIVFDVAGLQLSGYLVVEFDLQKGNKHTLLRLGASLGSAVQLGSPQPTCPDCGGELTQPRQFNLMFKTFLGPIEDSTAQTYLRPETAQGIFVNFNNVLTTTRRKLPFGIAQIGKAFRNEITVGNFIFRTREFEQMEIEFFVKPGTDDEWHQRWIQDCLAWYTGLGIAPGHLRVRQHEAHELSHYSKATADIEYAFPWGWGEIQGIANRTDFDLNAHSKASGVTLNYFDEEAKEHFTPYVIEPSAGVDRALLAFLLDAYHEEEAPTAEGKTEKRVVLKLHPALAPIKVAVLPLSRNERLAPKAREVYDLVRKNVVCQYDDAQSIGRRYRRQDEIGTPLCVTVDFQTVEDNAVTIRDRDTMQQERVAIPMLPSKLRERLDSK